MYYCKQESMDGEKWIKEETFCFFYQMSAITSNQSQYEIHSMGSVSYAFTII